MIKKLRQIINYDPLLGHKYVPGLKARVRYGKGAYFIETDERGFRNTPFEDPAAFTFIALGDSYTAGDGIDNHSRFTNAIQNKLSCNVYNMGVSGYGVDQQILAYEQYKDQVRHDAVLFFPNMDDLKRNMMTEREGIDQSSGKSILIPKPYFEYTDGHIELKNVPVPRERTEIVSEDQPATQQETAARPSLIQRKAKAAAFKAKQYYNYQVKGSQSRPELSDAASPEWLLMDKLIGKLIALANGKPVFIVPLPYNDTISNNEKPLFLEIFNAYAAKNIHVVDIIQTLKANYNVKNDQVFLPICGHYAVLGHSLIAGEVGRAIVAQTTVKERKTTVAKKASPDAVYTMGISCFYHDSAAAILKDGEIIAAAQEERFTRIKHDKAFPENAVNYCLEEAGIDISELRGICYYDNESWTLERLLQNKAAIGNKGDKLWDSAKQSMVSKIKLGAIIKSKYNYSGKIYKTEHHISHASSAFYASPFSEAAVLVIDGVGEWACSSIGEGTKNGGVKMIQQQYYPHSLGLLYSAITAYCGFKVNSGEYKLMGLAPYGEPKYADLIKDNLLKIYDDGSVYINQDYFAYLEGEKMTSDKFDALFGGPAREGESRITKREMDIAASLQQVTEEIVVKMANHAHRVTGHKNLVMAGGVALNCVANGKLYDQTPFEDFFFQPASGDAGCAVGAAYDLYYQLFQKEKKDNSIFTNSYLGPQFGDNEIEAFLQTKNIQHHRFNKGERARQVAEFAAGNNVIGYFDGRMEFGPRALGARSIIASPLSEEMQSKLNLKIKYRESFRPFAPIYAEEDTAEYFEFDRPSPYMLVVRPVKESLRTHGGKAEVHDEDLIKWVNEKRSLLPAITHVDYSARLQSVNSKENPVFHKILTEFKKITGYSVLINTSFNVRGEPIVCTPEDAYKCFMRTGMDVLVLGDFYLLKTEQPEWKESEEWEQLFTLD